MELKEYQVRVLETFDAYIAALKRGRAKLDKVRAINLAEPEPEQYLPLPDAGAEAWETLKRSGALPPGRAERAYAPRTTGHGEPLPNVCLKIPTGGGKTVLASECAARVTNAYRESNHGLVLWIVPNEAIYSQTRKSLANRDHPVRQRLDRAAAGRVKILEKADPIARADVEGNLCVMLLMLASANRETKETLRLFRDRGNVHGFFPAEGDFAAHQALLGRIGNLDVYGNAQNYGAEIKHSLGNVMRLVRPLVIMDEGHKAYSALARKTIDGFNPCFLLELSATPPAEINWLVDVRGADLDAEGMVKMPIQVETDPGQDWRACLTKAVERLRSLEADAVKLLGNVNRYIRPILLVQAERTGKDQRDGVHVHALDVKAYLQTLGFDEKELAIKTAEQNDLSQPENQNLLSPTNLVRVIVTKQALQEGWDCPFAYVLCSLAAQTAEGALTQLVGRILRQPQAVKTGVASLDQCYVHALHANTRDVVNTIRKGLEADGLGDLAAKVKADDESPDKKKEPRRIYRRPDFAKLDVYLPQVNWVDGVHARALDYEADLLQALDWRNLDMSPLVQKLPADLHAATGQRVSVRLGSGADLIETSDQQMLRAPERFDAVYATRVIADIVPNAWVAYALVRKLLSALHERGWTDSTIAARGGHLVEELRRYLNEERDRLAEARFRSEVESGRIQFRLRTDASNWELPRQLTTGHPEGAPPLMRPDEKLTEKSLFSPVYQADFNKPEAEFACYLDAEAALTWWHRNVAKVGYGVQGWRRHRVYPDFLFALAGKGKKRRLYALETKGEQLAGNLDTEYKRKLLELLTVVFESRIAVSAGEMELVGSDASLSCELVLLPEARGWLAKKTAEG
ncbi:MAG TPA: DEAD/DEAH box helicase family protein [Solimonas sp.]|nr:DEAD/DEAH box helicase family protein [Solimonas sp.]